MLDKIKAGKLEGMELKVYLQSNQVKRTLKIALMNWLFETWTR